MADAGPQQRDDHLVAYLHAYEDFLTGQLELQGALREGFFLLARARRDLSRSRNTGTPSIGALQFPQEIEAIARITQEQCESPNRPELRVVRRDPESSSADVALPPPAGHGRSSRDSGELSQEQQLRDLGVDVALSRQILQSLQATNEPMGFMCGDQLVIDGGSDNSSMRACSMRSDIKMAPSGLGSLKQAQLQDLLRQGGGDVPVRPRPSSANDPVRWFSVMPPPALRKSQANFQRAIELSVHLSNLRQRMRAAEAQYLAVR
jgi:hypothetical protein